MLHSEYYKLDTKYDKWCFIPLVKLLPGISRSERPFSFAEGGFHLVDEDTYNSKQN